MESILRTEPTARVLVGDDTHSLPHQWPKNVQIIPGPKKGFASNVNQLVRQAKGEWVVIMNNDVVLDSLWSQKMRREIARAKPQVWSLASSIYRKSGRIDSYGDGFSWYGIGFNRFHLGRPFTAKKAVILGPTGGLAVVRRRVFLELGGYSEVLQSYCEDTALNLLAWQRGYYSYYCPAPHAVHLGTSTFSANAKYRQSARNSILYSRIIFTQPLKTSLLKRVNWYWRAKARLSRRYRADILAGIEAGTKQKIAEEGPISAWPDGLPRESFWATNWRLLRQVGYSILRRLRLLKDV